MPGVNEKLQKKLVGLSVDLNRVEAGTRKRVLGHLKQLEDDLVLRISELRRSGDVAGDLRRLETTLRQTRKTIRRSMGAAQKAVRGDLREVGEYTRDAVVNIGNGVLGGSAFTTTLTRQQLAKMADNALIMGGPASDWWGKQTDDLQTRFATQMRLGLSQGESTDDLVERMRGRTTRRMETIEFPNGKRRRVRVYEGGTLDATRREIEATVRTSFQTVANDAMMQTYRDNADIISAVMAIATLDTRTTPICMARSGGKWDINTGEPLPDSVTKEGFPGSPPWHWNCRTVLAPVTRTWADLIEESTGKRLETLEDKIPVKTRASMGGPVRSDITFHDWLKSQPESIQIEALGRGKWELWRKDKITLQQLIDNRGRPLSVSDLRKRRGILPRDGSGAAPKPVEPRSEFTGTRRPPPSDSPPTSPPPAPRPGPPTPKPSAPAKPRSGAKSAPAKKLSPAEQAIENEAREFVGKLGKNWDEMSASERAQAKAVIRRQKREAAKAAKAEAARKEAERKAKEAAAREKAAREEAERKAREQAAREKAARVPRSRPS